MISVAAKKRLGDFFLDAKIEDGGFVCVTGKNGAGKSTLLNIISGVLPLDSGFVRIDSRDVTSLPIEKRGIVLVTPQTFIPHMRVEKHLTWGAKFRKRRVDEGRIQEIRKKLGIPFSGKVGELSLGMRERVSLATALISGPDLILVDEAFSNIDDKASFVAEYRELCSQANLDVIYTTQFPEDSRSADHKYWIENGVTSKVS
jgi:molybdate/tungstate transport system ATP-binding protein